jgi:hypothetical protein
MNAIWSLLRESACLMTGAGVVPSPCTRLLPLRIRRAEDTASSLPSSMVIESR